MKIYLAHGGEFTGVYLTEESAREHARFLGVAEKDIDISDETWTRIEAQEVDELEVIEAATKSLRLKKAATNDPQKAAS